MLFSDHKVNETCSLSPRGFIFIIIFRLDGNNITKVTNCYFSDVLFIETKLANTDPYILQRVVVKAIAEDAMLVCTFYASETFLNIKKNVIDLLHTHITNIQVYYCV